MTYLDELRELAKLHNDVVSVYLDMQTEVGDQGHEAPLRWRALRSNLSADGAPSTELELIEQALLARPTPVPHGHVLIAADGLLCLDAELPGWTDGDRAFHGVVAHTAPFVRWLQERVPYVVVLTDRIGADVSAYDGDGVEVSTADIVGPDDEIERNAPGGTAQLRYQHRAEDSWAHNAAAVADGVTRLAQRADAQAVVVAGDVRAVQLLQTHLPERLRDLVHVVHGDAPHGGHRNGIAPATLRAVVADVAADRRRRWLRELDEAAPPKRAVTGLADTLEALRDANVRRLYVVDMPSDDRLVYIGRQPTRITRRQPPTSDGERSYAVPLVDGLVHAAWGTDADVVVLTPDEASFAEGVAALLRH